MHEIRLETADGTDLRYVEDLLDAEGLPVADVRSGAAQFYLARAGSGSSADEGRVGVGAIEGDGPDALLRSVVVDPSMRGRGLGAALVDALEATARRDGVERLYLLTTTAADFFAAQGYEEIDRVEAPEAVRSTEQFSTLCPASATVMWRSL